MRKMIAIALLEGKKQWLAGLDFEAPLECSLDENGPQDDLIDHYCLLPVPLGVTSAIACVAVHRFVADQ